MAQAANQLDGRSDDHVYNVDPGAEDPAPRQSQMSTWFYRHVHGTIRKLFRNTPKPMQPIMSADDNINALPGGDRTSTGRNNGREPPGAEAAGLGNVDNDALQDALQGSLNDAPVQLPEVADNAPGGASGDSLNPLGNGSGDTLNEASNDGPNNTPNDAANDPPNDEPGDPPDNAPDAPDGAPEGAFNSPPGPVQREPQIIRGYARTNNSTQLPHFSIRTLHREIIELFRNNRTERLLSKAPFRWIDQCPECHRGIIMLFKEPLNSDWLSGDQPGLWVAKCGGCHFKLEADLTPLQRGQVRLHRPAEQG